MNNEKLLKMYRDLHQIPEIGMQEFETQQKLLAFIREMPQEFLEIKTWKTGILVHVLGKDSSHTLGYRTDMMDYRSQKKQACLLPRNIQGKCMLVGMTYI